MLATRLMMMNTAITPLLQSPAYASPAIATMSAHEPPSCRAMARRVCSGTSTLLGPRTHQAAGQWGMLLAARSPPTGPRTGLQRLLADVEGRSAGV